MEENVECGNCSGEPFFFALMLTVNNHLVRKRPHLVNYQNCTKIIFMEVSSVSFLQNVIFLYVP